MGSRVWLVLIVVLAMVVGPLSPAVATHPTMPDPVQVALDRYADLDGAGTVLLSRADEFVDALASGPLQQRLDAPLLLNPSPQVDPRVRQALERLAPERVILLGGSAALSEEVESELTEAGYAVERVAGATRVETAVAIASRYLAPAEGEAPLLVRAFGTGEDPTAAWADSIAAGNVAANHGAPVLLSETSHLSPPTAQYLMDAGIGRVRIVGGIAALSAQVADDLADLGVAVERVAGATRAHTAALLRDPAPGGAAGEDVVVVDGWHPLSWVAGFTRAQVGGGIVLTNRDDLPEVSRHALASTAAETPDVVCDVLVHDAACDAASSAMTGPVELLFSVHEVQDPWCSRACPFNLSVWGAAADGSHARQIIDPYQDGNTDGRDHSPSWSPDGTRLAFFRSTASHVEVHIADVDGEQVSPARSANDIHGPRCVALYDSRIAWSPDGSRIASSCQEYSADGPPRGGITVIETDANGPQLITRPDAVFTSPSWSPDGSQLAYSAREDGSETATIEVVTTDASGFSTPRVLAETRPRYDPQPVEWSPDGTLIAFGNDNTRELNGVAELQTIRPDGTGLRTVHRVGVDPSGIDDVTWSPDSTQLAFVANDPRAGNSDLFITDLAGTARQLSPTNTGNTGNPSWATNGEQIAFTYLAALTEPGGIAAVSVDTGAMRYLVPAGGPRFSPHSPDLRPR